MLIFDIETDGLLREATTIHCIVVYNLDTRLMMPFFNGNIGVPAYGQIQDGVEYLKNELKCGGRICGHNICGFDLPLLQKFFPGVMGTKFLSARTIEDKIDKLHVVDTMMLSCLLFPEIQTPGLEYWGTQLGVEKPYQEQWHTFDLAMLNRCTTDVEINTKLWLEVMEPKLVKQSKDGINWQPALSLEQTVQEIHAQQELHGVRYNVEKAIKLYHRLDARAKELAQQILETVPLQVTNPYKGTPVNKPYKKDGTFSAMVENHYAGCYQDLSKANIKGPFSRIGYAQLNLDSDMQVKNYLLSLGWQPTEWNMSKKTRERTSPKLTEDSYGSLPDGVGKEIAEYNIVTHRQGLVANRKGEQSGGLWKVREDGRVPAKAFTCGTPTSRYRHQEVVCNIPRPGTPYGEEIRELFCVPDEWWMLGLDLKGIEIRMAAHFAFVYPGGDALAAEILSGDFHTMNAQIWGVDRNSAKTGLYALMYGCTPPKLAQSLGRPINQGKRLFADFWDNRKPLKLLNDDLIAAYKRKGSLTGLDGRRLKIREERKLLNTLIQGASAVIFKYWMWLNQREMEKSPVTSPLYYVSQVIAYHDELQYECRTPLQHMVEEVARSFQANALLTGARFKITVPVEADYKIGKNWKDTH